jgi:virulence-associated protein VapD
MVQNIWTIFCELKSLLEMIDFSVPAADNLEKIRKYKNKIIRIVHPDKNAHDVPAAVEAVKLWNEAYEKTKMFLELSVFEEDYSTKYFNQVDDIILYMNEYGLSAMKSNAALEKENEDNAFKAQIIENAKQLEETHKTIKKINREADEAYEKEEQGMYIDANILM